MEYIMNKEKYSDRTLSDEEIEHKIDYSAMYRTSMDSMNRDAQRNVHDAKAIDEHFEKHFW
jgi:hypothetical protein